MFVGHFALGFAAKRAAPRVPLAWLFVGAQLADLLWPAFVALGIEQVRIDPGNTAFTPLDFVSYPYSHSLLMLVVWGIALGLVYRVSSRDARAFWILAALVVSHWVLDFVTHRADMPLFPGSAKFGLSLWNVVPLTFAVELILFALGVWIYVRTTKARDPVGRWALVSLVVFLLIVYIAAFAGGPPPSVTAIWSTALGGGLLLLIWGAWVDRHRRALLDA